MPGPAAFLFQDGPKFVYNIYFEQKFAKRLLNFIFKTLFSQTVTYDTIAKVGSVNVCGIFPETPVLASKA